MLVEVPCDAAGGHAAMMDACDLIGHQATWVGMIDAITYFVQRVAFGDHSLPSAADEPQVALGTVAPNGAK